MSKVIALLSGSGGCGKTVLAAAMGAAISRRDKRALVIDLCAGARGLDMPLGLESRAVYDLGDVLSGGCSVEQAIITDQARACPDMIAAALDDGELDASVLAAMLAKLRREYDWIALDAPTGGGKDALLAAGSADTAIIATLPDNSSVRAAERALAAARTADNAEIFVIINKIIPSFIPLDAHLTPDAVAQTLDSKLLGVVPYDEAVARQSALGRVTEIEMRSPGFQAISVAADRTLGAAIPKRWAAGRRGLRLSETIWEEWD